MKKELKFNFFYKTENKITGQYYYGAHRTDNLDDGYMGSGIRILRAIKKYGKENFEHFPLKFFETFDDALNYEAEVVTEELVNDINCYNLKVGGKGGFAYSNKGKILVKDENGKHKLMSLTDEQLYKEYVPAATEMVVVKDKNNNMFRVSINDERYLTKKLKPIWTGKTHSAATKLKMGIKAKERIGVKNSQFGTRWINNGNESKKIHKEAEIPFGWQLGRKHLSSSVG